MSAGPTGERERTIAGRFRALPPKQRILLGVLGMVFSYCGLMFSDALEKADTRRDVPHKDSSTART